MSTNIKLYQLREVRERVFGCLAIVMLSVDTLNPIKAVCGAFGWNSGWVAVVAIAAMISLLYAYLYELSYFFCKVIKFVLFFVFLISPPSHSLVTRLIISLPHYTHRSSSSIPFYPFFSRPWKYLAKKTFQSMDQLFSPAII